MWETHHIDLTVEFSPRNIFRLMSDLPNSLVPEHVDAWRMVTARREFEGRIPLAAMTRLRDALLEPDGDARYTLAFGTDALQVPFAELRIEAELPLECQRSLQRFLLPVHMVQRLGLIRDEADEAALPAEYEALLVPVDGVMRLQDLVEDELVLAVPAVPMNPESDAVDRDWPIPEQELAQASPFAALSLLKKN